MTFKKFAILLSLISISNPILAAEFKPTLVPFFDDFIKREEYLGDVESFGNAGYIIDRSDVLRFLKFDEILNHFELEETDVYEDGPNFDFTDWFEEDFKESIGFEHFGDIGQEADQLSEDHKDDENSDEECEAGIQVEELFDESEDVDEFEHASKSDGDHSSEEAHNPHDEEVEAEVEENEEPITPEDSSVSIMISSVDESKNVKKANPVGLSDNEESTLKEPHRVSEETLEEVRSQLYESIDSKHLQNRHWSKLIQDSTDISLDLDPLKSQGDSQTFRLAYSNLQEDKVKLFKQVYMKLFQGTQLMDPEFYGLIKEGAGLKNVFDRLDTLIVQEYLECLNQNFNSTKGLTPKDYRIFRDLKYNPTNVDTLRTYTKVRIGEDLDEPGQSCIDVAKVPVENRNDLIRIARNFEYNPTPGLNDTITMCNTIGYYFIMSYSPKTNIVDYKFRASLGAFHPEYVRSCDEKFNTNGRYPVYHWKNHYSDCYVDVNLFLYREQFTERARKVFVDESTGVAVAL
ncbi:hypothetical protein WICPIJ_002129 [Wickerhamomyces pijperi]|uniref:Secreted protein n=1 Tax=Wickerhamomyces pijperi TaxID=599730 RepID=A0A9P8TP88_WICPI|nr:hypothetical protein WICPIJ_002129 [Wickerhamomyces pijperi]